jgi:hypothetical protein
MGDEHDSTQLNHAPGVGLSFRGVGGRRLAQTGPSGNMVNNFFTTLVEAPAGRRTTAASRARLP